MDQNNLNSQVDTMFTNMEHFTQQNGLLGKPFVQGDKTFLPVMSLTFGYAGGDMQTKAKTPNPNIPGSSGALGAGAKLSTDAVLVMDKNNVMLAPVNAQPGNIGQIINQIPQIVNNMGGKQQQSGQPQPPGQSQPPGQPQP